MRRKLTSDKREILFSKQYRKQCGRKKLPLVILPDLLVHVMGSHHACLLRKCVRSLSSWYRIMVVNLFSIQLNRIIQYIPLSCIKIETGAVGIPPCWRLKPWLTTYQRFSCLHHTQQPRIKNSWWRETVLFALDNYHKITWLASKFRNFVKIREEG